MATEDLCSPLCPQFAVTAENSHSIFSAVANIGARNDLLNTSRTTPGVKGLQWFLVLTEPTTDETARQSSQYARENPRRSRRS